jgi:hypothetical protein
MRRFTFGSLTTTKRHGCWLAPDGPVPAAAMALRTISIGTGSRENERTVRRVRMRARKRSEAAMLSSADWRSNVSGSNPSA